MKSHKNILKDIVKHPGKYNDKQKIAAMKLIMINAALIIKSLSKKN